MVSSSVCPSPAMDIITTSNQKSRPTQSYFVPRPVLENNNRQETERSPTPKEANNNKNNNGAAALYTPPHFRKKQSPQPSSTSTPPSLFASSCSSSSSSSSKSSLSPKPRPLMEIPDLRTQEPPTPLFPKIISIPSSSSSSANKSASPARETFSSAPSGSAPPADKCICDRPKTHVACKRCGYECSGRLSLVCALHPYAMNLMDLSVCPNALCHSVQLYEVLPR